MQIYRAEWIVRVSRPPLHRGWVAVDGGAIVGVGGAEDPVPQSSDGAEALNAAILPGLVNAHTHLELSWMRDCVPPAASMPDWASRLIALRASTAAPPTEGIADAIRQVRETGTVLVGDVTNTLAACGDLAASDLHAAVFFELLGFRVHDPDPVIADARARLESVGPRARLRLAIVPHALFSVSPMLLRAIGAAAQDAPLSIHLGESAAEVQFLRDGTGPWRDVLQRVGAWEANWTPPDCSPVEYLERLGLVDGRLVAVHAVQLTDPELARLAEAGATVVTCPRSNRWTGAGTPPIERFYASGVRVAIGTDSLASAPDLNMFHELAEVRRIAPEVPAGRLLRSATFDGALALGFGSELGTIDPGKRAKLLVVRLPEGTTDVEEYLVSGIEPHDVRLLSDLTVNLGPEPWT